MEIRRIWCHSLPVRSWNLLYRHRQMKKTQPPTQRELEQLRTRNRKFLKRTSKLTILKLKIIQLSPKATNTILPCSKFTTKTKMSLRCLLMEFQWWMEWTVPTALSKLEKFTISTLSTCLLTSIQCTSIWWTGKRSSSSHLMLTLILKNISKQMEALQIVMDLQKLPYPLTLKHSEQETMNFQRLTRRCSETQLTWCLDTWQFFE